MGSAILSLAAYPFDMTPSTENTLQFEMLMRRMESILPVLSLRVSSLLIGIVCWWQSFIVTYRLLGGVAVMVGTLCV
jgi:hypothetical protein